MIGPHRHDGELRVRRRAAEGHDGLGSAMFGPEIPLGFVTFLARQPMLIISASDDDGRVWTNLLAGEEGFAVAVDRRTVIIDALPAHGGPLRDSFDQPRGVGMLAIDVRKRRRVRINGSAHRRGAALVVRTEQVLGNCPKYIHTRQLREVVDHPTDSQSRTTPQLDAAQREWVSRADTFFIGSYAEQYGADASHRGGHPGFISVDSPHRLSWPDYAGNSFYMTLGNLALRAACGLLFVDWLRGHTLHLAGRAHVDWDEDRADERPGALRTVVFDIDQVVQVDNASPLRWDRGEPSAHCPPLHW